MDEARPQAAVETGEHDMHLYFQRAKASEVTLGDATYHRELVAEALDL